MRSRCQAPPTVVALVPSAGPVPPPMMVVMPAAECLVEELWADQVDVTVDGPGGQDAAVARQDLGRRADHEGGVDTIHRVGVAGLADADDATVSHTDVGLHHAPVVEDDRSRDHEIGGTLGARARRLAHRLADHLATAEDHLVPAGAAVLGHLDPQVGVGETHPVARGRAVQVPVASPVDEAHGASSASVLIVGSSGPPTAPRKPGIDPGADERDEFDVECDSRLEPDGGAGGHVQAMAAGRVAVEDERRVGLSEVIVRTDLDRPVATVLDAQPQHRSTGIDLDRVVRTGDLARDHGAEPIGSWSVTSFVPSGNVASTWTSSIISATPSITSSRVST